MQTTDTPVVHVTGLTKRFAAHITAVDKLDLTISAGETYGFLGPNGAGKTTTLRILTGLVAPTSGRVHVLGGAPSDSRVQSRTGSLIETPAFYPYLSGRDNLRVLAGHAGNGGNGGNAGNGAAARAGVDELLERVSLSARGRDRFSTYSLGMKQRLGVAAALLKDPELVILDEPTNGLDPAGMRDMRTLVRELGDEGRTVILSSHLLSEVQQLCDRVGIINEGRMVAERTVAELRGQRELVVSATPLTRARAELVGLLGDGAVREYDETLHVRVPPERVPEVNRALVQAGVEVFELRTAERALEDVFFEMTTRQEMSHA